jgi:acetyltransferase-like isoleucine patch superfamily enzyme
MKPIISKNIRVRVPEHFEIGEYSIVDDFCYFSTKVKVGKCSHIASGCSIAGGGKRQFILGDFCSLSSGVKIWCSSDDFTNDIVALLPKRIGDIKNNFIEGDVKIGDFCAIGSNTVVMPKNKIPDGTVIGALSFVPKEFEFKPWSVYVGIPIRYVKPRNKQNVMRQFKEIEQKMKGLENDE